MAAIFYHYLPVANTIMLCCLEIDFCGSKLAILLLITAKSSGICKKVNKNYFHCKLV